MPSPAIPLAIISILVSFQFLYVGADLIDTTINPIVMPERPTNPLQAVLSGVQLTWEVLTFVGSFVVLLFKFLTFQVPGAPPWVQWPIGTILLGSVGYSIFALFRGSGA